jgi:hypothetical protein
MKARRSSAKSAPTPTAPVAPTAAPPRIDDILEATAQSAIRFTHADRGHAYLVARDEEDRPVVTHQCLAWSDGSIVRQYERARRLLDGPCQQAIREGRTVYVHDAGTNPLHQKLLRELRAREKALKGDRLRLEYVQRYREFLEPAKSYLAVPIKRPGGEPVGVVALYSTATEDFFGVLRKRIIEEYLDNFANALITALIDKAAHVDVEAAPPRVFDEDEASPWDGTGPYLERLVRHHLRRGSWNRAISEIERFLLTLALRRSGGRPTQALELVRMPRRTFFAKLKKHGITTKPEREESP